MRNLISIIFSIFLVSETQGQVAVYKDIAYHDIAGVDANLLSFDAYVPSSSEPLPMVIYVHGGGWAIGDKSVFHKKANYFNSKGYIFVSINYRLSPNPAELDNLQRITYPIHPQDVAKAISFLLDNAVEYGADLDKVVLIGHSAGAHLVSTIMSNESFLEAHGHHPSEIRCLCSMDTAGYDIVQRIETSPMSYEVYANAFTTDTTVWKDASPINHIFLGKSLPSTLIVHQNKPFRQFLNENFANKIKDLTDTQVQLLATDYEHDELNQKLGDYSSEESATYSDEIGEWFASCLTGSLSNKTQTKPSENIFPNPASDIVKFSSFFEYQIHDNTGKLVNAGKGMYTDVSNLPIGVYTLSLTNQNLVSSTKLIVRR